MRKYLFTFECTTDVEETVYMDKLLNQDFEVYAISHHECSMTFSISWAVETEQLEEDEAYDCRQDLKNLGMFKYVEWVD